MNNEPRFVLDESSLNLETISLAEAEKTLQIFSRTLTELQSAHAVEVSENLWATTCWHDQPLWQVVWERPHGLDRDLCTLLGSKLDRCARWIVTESDIESVVIDGDQRDIALGVSHACASVAAGHGKACLVANGVSRVATVSASKAQADVHFVADPDAVARFFRSLYAVENIDEDHFFSIVRFALPRLDFVRGLTFRPFHGGYTERDLVVHHLGILNDRYLQLAAEYGGQEREIGIRMSANDGINVSRESPKTRASKRLMAKRSVEHEGASHTCEWHSKLHPDVNRIHFVAIEQRILIGLFVEHLPT